MRLVAAALFASVLGAQSAPFGIAELHAIAEQARSGAIPDPRGKLGEIERQARTAGDVRSEAFARAGLAAVSEFAGRWRMAEDAVRAAATPAVLDLEPRFVAKVAVWLSRESAEWERLDRARRWARMAESEYRAANDAAGLATALHASAIAHAGPQRGPLLEQALAVAREAGDAMLVAAIQADLGESMRRDGRLAEAIDMLQRAVAVQRGQAPPGDTAWTLTLLGRAQATHGNHAGAIAALEESDAMLAHDPGERAAITRLELARVQAIAGQRGKALAMLDKIRDSGAPNATSRRRVISLAAGYLALGEHQRAASVVEAHRSVGGDASPPALDHLYAAACFHLGRHESAIEAATTAIAKSGNRDALTNASAYRWRAKALDRLGRMAEAAADMLEVARLGNATFGKLAPDDEWRRGFSETRKDFVDDVIAVLWRAGKREDALRAAEDFRARAFLELVAERGHPSRAGLDQLVSHAKSAGVTALSYYSHPEALYVWVIRPDGAIESARSSATSVRVKALIERARASRYKPDRDAWRELYRLLIQPVRAWLPRGGSREILVLPHGPLMQLPFAALIDTAGRYLIEDYAVRVAPAAEFAARTGAVSGHVLLAGPPGAGSRLPDLPSARVELQRVKELLPGPHRALSAERLREDAAGARVLHFATHAVADAARPFESYLALSASSKLTAGAIYDMRLQADLVTLSACQAGSGRVSADGLLGFTRAFLYAGAASVLAPLWDIPDGPTLRLVEEFYRRYGRGVSKSEALRAAQLRVLSELRSGRITAETSAGPMTLPEHPALWAGFVLQGAR